MKPVVVLLVLLHVLVGCMAAGVKPKPKRIPQINWNSSYYNEEFRPCKPFRVLNPVEKMRAQKLAVDCFRRCGSKVMSLAAFKYKFPSFAIAKGLKYFCLLYTVMFAYVANDGGLILSPKTESAELIELALKITSLVTVPGNELTVKHGTHGHYVIPTRLIEETASYFFRCADPGKLTIWLDGDVVKYCTSHHEKMLL